MPEESRFVGVTSPVSDSDLFIPVDDLPGWLQVGQSLEIRSGSERQIVVVDSWGAGQINLVSGVSGDWPVGSRVFQLREGRFEQTMRLTLGTNTSAGTTLAFVCDPKPQTEVLGAAEQTFNGRELWLMRPNWSENPTSEIQGYLDTLDYSRGPLSHFSPVDFGTRIEKLTYLSKTRPEAESLVQFFSRMRGQQGEFYMPTWEPDFDLSVGALSASDTLVIPGTDFYDQYAESPVYKAVFVLMRDGSYVAKMIESITTDTVNSTLTVDSYWSKVINEDTAVMGCMLPVWRFATDTLTVEFVTREVAQTQVSMRTLEDL